MKNREKKKKKIGRTCFPGLQNTTRLWKESKNIDLKRRQKVMNPAQSTEKSIDNLEVYKRI